MEIKKKLLLSFELLLFIWRLIRKQLGDCGKYCSLSSCVALSRVVTIYKESIKHETYTYCLLMPKAIKHDTYYILSFYVTRLLSTHHIQLIKLEQKNTHMLVHCTYCLLLSQGYCPTHMLAITRKTNQTTCNENKRDKGYIRQPQANKRNT